MFKKYSLKKQFIFTLIMVIVCSALSSMMLTYLVFLGFTNNDDEVYEYYDKKVDQIKIYVSEVNTSVLDVEFRSDLEKLINVDRFKYEVVDLEKGRVYGNLEVEEGLDKRDLVSKINTKEVKDDVSNIYLPVADNSGELRGAVCVSYDIGTVVLKSKVFKDFITVGASSIFPFVFIIVYTIIFGRIFSKNITDGFEKLMKASDKIKSYDLDFELDYPYDNEIGQLVSSFESMRVELKNTIEKQWVLEEEKRDMIASLSHDLRTPLTVIKGHTELLIEGAYKKEDRLLRYLSSIESSTNRAVVLVEDLNSLSKLDSSGISLNKEFIGIRAFVEDKALDYFPLCEKYGVSLDVHFEGVSEDLVVEVDKFMMSRVIDNIVMNSFRFVSGGGVIVIFTRCELGKVIFRVSDDGIGFSENDLSCIFDKFYKGDKSRSSENGNSGLGLYISKNIVESHGGSIKAYNKNGAVVEVCLRGAELRSRPSVI